MGIPQQWRAGTPLSVRLRQEADPMKGRLVRRRFLDRMSVLSGRTALAWLSLAAAAVADGRVLYGPPPRGRERLCLERADGHIFVTGLTA
jgi:hypothetical protein